MSSTAADESCSDTRALLELTPDPPAEFRPVPFWSWNERMEPAEVAAQVRHIAEGGWGGAFVHARVGLTIDYLGQAWFDAADAAVETCREGGLLVWLYDEDKWPSGFSGGTVPLAEARFRQHALLARPAGTPPPEGCARVAGGRDLEVYVWRAPLGSPWFNGTCYTDLMGRDAVGRFVQDAYEPYHARYAGDYGRLVRAQFTDEPCSIFRLGIPRGAVPWSPDLPGRHRELHGEDVADRLPLLFADAPDAAAFRLRYYRTVNDLFERNFSARLGKWCADRGIALTGHYMSEHGLFEQQVWGVNVMPNYAHMHVPGVDHLARQVEERVTAKQCASAANQFGRRRVLSELYGVSGQNLTFADRFWIACQQVALGVNLLNPHLSLYTLAGCRKRDYPPNLFYQQPWWPLNRVLDDALSRVCLCMSRGTYEAQVLLLHPQQSTFTLWQGRTGPGDGRPDGLVNDHHPATPESEAAIRRLDATFKRDLDALLAAQVGLDLGDENVLARHAVASPAGLDVGPMTYPVVVVPPMHTVAATTLGLIEQLLDHGRTVLTTARPPALLDGEASPRVADVFARVRQVAPGELAEAVRQAGVTPTVDFAPADGGTPATPGLISHVRRLDGGAGRLVFLTNLSRTRSQTGRLTLDPGGSTCLLRLELQTGAWSTLAGPADRHTFDLDMGPGEARLYWLHTSTGTQAEEVEAEAPTPAMAAEVEWSVERLDDNCLPLDVVRWREGEGPLSREPVPVLAMQNRLNALRYQGPVVLQYAFDVQNLTAGRSVRLVVEYPERFRIKVNGKSVDTEIGGHWRDIRWTPLDVSPHVVPGINVVEMTLDFQFGDLACYDDAARRYGTELEAVYLVGDFAVDAAVVPESPRCPAWENYRLPPQPQYRIDRPRLTDPQALRTGDMAAQGLPFYAGRLRWTTRLPRDFHGGRLVVDETDAAVTAITLDDRLLGHLWAPPFVVPVPAGGGTLCLDMYGTLRNLLGPHHHPEGELPAVTPSHFLPPGLTPDAVVAWSRGEVPADWRTGYNVVGFGNPLNLRLESLAR